MSERGYFSQRNLIPGAAFLLVVIAYNFAPIFRILENQQVDAALSAGVLALIGGPALGFLISQLWWWYFQGTIAVWKWKPIEELILKYHLSDKTDGVSKRNALMVYDYVLHSELHSVKKGDKDGLSRYAFRRWDNYVLLAIVEFTIGLGAVTGVIARVLSEIFIFGDSFWEYPKLHSLVLLNGKEYWILVVLLIIIIILIFALDEGRMRIRFEYDEIHRIAIKDSKITQKQIFKLFPKEYFSDDAQKAWEEAQKEKNRYFDYF